METFTKFTVEAENKWVRRKLKQPFYQKDIEPLLGMDWHLLPNLLVQVTEQGIMGLDQSGKGNIVSKGKTLFKNWTQMEVSWKSNHI